jgi:hypothetical protein
MENWLSWNKHRTALSKARLQQAKKIRRKSADEFTASRDAFTLLLG